MFFIMKTTKSIFLAVIASLAINFSIFAIPGVEQPIQDQSGQFVYYKDSTFDRESYIGIIFFDDSTYGLRYYAPTDLKNGKPETKMQVYLTIDSVLAATKGKIEFTGERVEPLPSSQDETDIINYLHDFVYELFPKRIMIGTIDKTYSENCDYAQFGGRVSIQYDSMIPVLNLKQIVTSDGKIALSAITGGKLINSTDTTFTDFKGIPAKSSASAEKVKKGKSAKIEIENEGLKSQVFELDSNWEQKSAASWMYKSVAAVSSAVLPINDAQKNVLLRSLILGRDHSYPDWTKQKFSEKNGKIELSQIFYDSDSKSFKNDFKKIETLNENAKSIFTLTVDSASYTKNKSYFDGIVNSYKIN